MNQYRIVKINKDDNSSYPFVFFEILDDSELYHSYIEIEKTYIDIVYDIISVHDGFILEIEFIYEIEREILKYYSREEREKFEYLLNLGEGSKTKISRNELKNYIKFILREHINAQISNFKEEVLFGYIYDFQSLVYSNELDSEKVNKINSKGFIIEEFYFSFDFEE